MSATTTVPVVTQGLATLKLRLDDQRAPIAASVPESTYRYAHLLPSFSKDEHFPPLTPFEHIDPASRALTHENPRAFLDNATSVIDLTPRLGTEITGVNLAELDAVGRDQLALEVARRGVIAFRDQHDFIDRGPEFYLEWGRHFGRYDFCIPHFYSMLTV